MTARKREFIPQGARDFKRGTRVHSRANRRLFFVFDFALAVLLGVGFPIPAVSQTDAPTDSSLTPHLSAAEIRQGWISLFDGQTLYGWKAESEVNWRVEAGEIRADSGQVGLLRTTSQFGDFQLRLEYRCPPETNSGVFLLTNPQPKNPETDCYEVNIAPTENPFPTGSLVGRQRATSPAPESAPETWRLLTVQAEQGRITVHIDQAQVLEYVDPRPLGRGFIGLQFNSGPVAFRNIALLPLAMERLWNGVDLTGWNTGQQLASRFEVTAEGELHLLGGRGLLESDRQFTDFVLALECRTNAVGLNSGVFFRCLPGQVMNGYESQIHHGTIEGDDRRPADYGTGGIFRRQPARRVVSRDEEWFVKTIIATGPHFAVWVNGYQVCDWSDAREPHENPRHGKRLEGGTFQLQGHDPGTDLLFRNLQAAELPLRQK